jgi:hypothetical protein
MADTNGATAKKKTKPPALYHLFSVGAKGVLTPVGDETAKNGEAAVEAFVDKPPEGQEELAKRVKEGNAKLAVIPDRNYAVIGAQEEIKRTLKIKALNKS